jgi:hypothetical protein
LVQRNSNDGVLTRTVCDTAVTLDYLARSPNGGSFISTPTPNISFLNALDSDPAPLRIVLCTNRLTCVVAPDPQVVA